MRVPHRLLKVAPAPRCPGAARLCAVMPYYPLSSQHHVQD